MHYLLCIISILLFQAEVYGQTQIAPKYSPNKTVNAIIPKGDTLIVGGAFNYVGRYTGGGALFSVTADTPNANFPKIIGEIYSSTPDGSGGFYIYGNYHREAEAATAGSPRIEHILADFSFESGFSLSVDALFKLNKILYHDGILYIGGNYVAHIAGQPTGDFCGVDVSTKLLVSWLPTIDSGGNVQTFNVSGNTIYVAGDFYKIGGQYRNKIAAIQVNTGIVKPWMPLIPTPGYSDIVFYQNKIILGGGLSAGGSIGFSDHACAMIDTISGGAVQYIFNATNYLYHAASVQRLAIIGDTLFTYSGGTFDTRVTAIYIPTGTNIWTKYFNMIAGACDMIAINGSLFVAGSSFTETYITNMDNAAANFERKVNCAVCLDTRTGNLRNWFPDPVGFIYNDVWTMSKSGTNIFIGGKFSHVNGLPRGSVFMLNTVTQQVLPFQIRTNLFDECKSLKLIDSILYVAGTFSNINDSSYNTSVAAFNINTGQQLPWYPANLGNAFTVEANAQHVFIGGSLNEPSGGTGRTNLFAIDRVSGSLSTWSPNPDGNVNSLHLANGRLYVGGEFSNISGQPRGKIAAYDTSLALTSWQPTVGTVKAIFSSDSVVWIGNSNNSFAGYDVISGTLRKEPLSALSFGSEIRSVAGKGRYVIIGGNFSFTGSPCKNVAIYDILNDTLLPNSSFCMAFTNGSEYINAVAVSKDDLYIGGDFTNVNSKMDATNVQCMRFPSGFFSGDNDSGTVAYYPKSGGNGGDVTINFWGNAIKPGMHLKLTMMGAPDIVVPDSSISFPKKSEMMAIVDLRGRPIGEYNVVIEDSITTTVHNFSNGFKIVNYKQAKPWVHIIGNSLLRTGVKSTLIIQIGTDENCDVHGLSLLLSASQTDSVKFQSNIGLVGTTISDSTLFFQINDTDSKLEKRMGCWLIIPKITAGAVKNIIIKYTPTISHDISFTAVVGNALEPGYRKVTGVKSCAESALSYAANLASAALNKFPITACAISTASSTNAITKAFENDNFSKADAFNLGGSVLGTMATCLTVAFPELALVDFASKFFTGMGIGTGMYSGIKDCSDLSEDRDTYSGKSRTSVDPNEKIGTGVGIQHYITGQTPLSYGIQFQNASTASLPAQIIRIVDTLDAAKLDLATFYPTLVTIGDRVVNVTPGKFKISGNENIEYVDLRPATNLILETKTKLNIATGVFEATLTSLDPTTMQLTTNPLLGFLPPDTIPPSGEGAIYYSVQPKSNLPNKTEIRNKAYIYFDSNPSIETQTWINTLDTLEPVSKVDSLPATIPDTTFTVKWHGHDGESGVEKYDLYYAINSSSFQLYAGNIFDTSIQFTGKPDTSYAFYTVAADSVGNKEQKDTLDTKTTIKLRSDSQDVSIYPNPNNGAFIIHLSSAMKVFDLALFDIYGKNVGFNYTQANANYFVSMHSGTPRGVYIVKIKTANNTIIKKIVVE